MVCLLVCATALVSLLAAATALGKGREVRVGVYENKPKIFMGENGSGEGLFADILSAVAKAEGWTLRYEPCEWAACLLSLESGRIDLMPDVARSKEREEKFDFHEIPVAESWSQIYAQSGAAIERISDLSGKRVAVLDGSVQHQSLERMLMGFKLDTKLISTESLDHAFQLAADGSADAAVANRFFGDYSHRDFNLVKTPIVFEAAKLYFAVKKGRNADLLEPFDRHLKAWREQMGSPYYASLAKWMGRPQPRFIPAYILWSLGIAAGLLIVFAALALLLRIQVRARTKRLAEANEDLRKTHEALKNSEALLNAAERLSKVGGWEYDVEKQLMTWTEEASRILGVPRKDSSPETVEVFEKSLQCFDPEIRDSLKEAFERCVASGEPYDLECPFTSEEGRKKWVRATALPVLNEQGKVVRVTGNIMDITERKREEEVKAGLEEHLRIAQKMEAIGQLAGGIAHDFNNLIFVILNCADMAGRALIGQESVRNHLEQIQKTGERAAAMTRQLLSFSSNQLVEPTFLDLNSVLEELLPMLKQLLQNNTDIEIIKAPDLGRVRADRGQMEQVMVNLAVNARDAMPEGGRLTIETTDVERDDTCVDDPDGELKGPFVMLSMTDTGVGMDKAIRSRIFDPFFTTKEKGKGTGLGLATVYGIVKQSGGVVRVQSEPGKGAVFKVCLPRVDDEEG